MLGAMAQPEKSAAAVHAKAMLEALKEILKSQNSGIPLTLLVPELSLYLYQSSHFTCTRALTVLVPELSLYSLFAMLWYIYYVKSL